MKLFFIILSVIIFLMLAFVSIIMIIAEIMFKFSLARLKPKKNKKKKPSKANGQTTKEGLIWKDLLNQLNIFNETLKKMPYTRYTIKSARNNELVGYLYKRKTSNKRLIILSHGWHSDGLNTCGIMGEFYFYRYDFDILVLLHEGHSESEGKYIGFSIWDGENIKKWVDFINEKTNFQYHIFLHGLSMGASAVLMACKHHLPSNVCGIIEDCGFTQGYEELTFVAKNNYHFPPKLVIPLIHKKTLRKLKYDIKETTIDALKGISIPILFIHGRKDNFVPCYMTEQNYEKYQGPKELLIINEAYHAQSCFLEPDLYRETVLAFIDKYDK